MYNDRRWCDAQVPFEPSQQARGAAEPPSSPLLPTWGILQDDPIPAPAHTAHSLPASSPLPILQQEDALASSLASSPPPVFEQEDALASSPPPVFEQEDALEPAILPETIAAETLTAIASSAVTATSASASAPRSALALSPSDSTSTSTSTASSAVTAASARLAPASSSAPASSAVTASSAPAPASSSAPASSAVTASSAPAPASASSSAPALSAPASTNIGPSSEWPLKEELRGTQAHHYRGPLPPARVLSLLSSSISKNGRLSLTGTRAGYLSYFHYLGPDGVPNVKKRASKNLRGTELWQCRLCHEELHVPATQISNLGDHVYGKKSRPGRGCLISHEHNPAERVPPPSRDESGSIIRLQASKDLAPPPRPSRP
ncbi:hypothetical protein A4X13_0g934 [Tilletia indica]|uniref:Uncharacterized protein n=1 Tax=Tilletia indica TaxID=43049 RepID=A0A177TFK1_9BASI|nr:hypothetical protein A4X13_0g934 [Tilletia indica]